MLKRKISAQQELSQKYENLFEILVQCDNILWKYSYLWFKYRRDAKIQNLTKLMVFVGTAKMCIWKDMVSQINTTNICHVLVLLKDDISHKDFEVLYTQLLLLIELLNVQMNKCLRNQ